MTKQEKDKCEKLLDDVYLHLNNAEPNWDVYERAKREKCYGNAETSLRLYESNRSYAEGIYQALAVLGYKSEKMMEIGKKL